MTGIDCLRDFDLRIGKEEQYFYGRGKVLLSGEYFVLDGAKALALPTATGQSMKVHYSQSYTPKLTWKSYDVFGNLWLEAIFEFWHFNCIGGKASWATDDLQKLLRQARKQNPHFLRDDVDIHVETRLGFPLKWGLGSSSSLIYNIAQWAYISPFELAFNTFGGSGYDIACAQSNGPIIYRLQNDGPRWETVNFDPPFKDSLYFVYLGKKQNSRDAIKHYRQKGSVRPETVMSISILTDELIESRDQKEFEFLLKAHEDLIVRDLKLVRAKDLYFSDYWGEVKSLGAWGGDFVLVTSNRSSQDTRDYFTNKGFDTFIPYRDFIHMPNNQNKMFMDDLVKEDNILPGQLPGSPISGTAIDKESQQWVSTST